MAARRASSNDVYLFAHSTDEFPDVELLQDYLNCGLVRDNQREYHVVTARLYRRPQPGDLVVFHKWRLFLGEGIVDEALEEYPGKRRIGKGWYTGHLLFKSKGLRAYKEPVDFEKVERKLGKRVSSRPPCQTGDDVYRILATLV